jgi:hypothetical protein
MTFGTPLISTVCEGSEPEGKRDITDIARLQGEGASGTCTETLDANGLGVKQVLFSDVPFPLPEAGPPISVQEARCLILLR